MPSVTVLFWRDIPAQVIVGKGRNAAKRQLDIRFEQAIDRAAMKSGARDSDAYLSEWRKGTATEIDGTAPDVADETARRIDAEFDAARLKRLVENDGWA